MRTPPLAPTAVAGAVLADVVLLALQGGNDIANAAPALASAVAAAGCGYAAVQAFTASARRAWSLMAFAASGWTLNAAALGLNAQVRLISGVAAAIAVVMLLDRSMRVATKVRVLVDGLVAAVSLVFLAWGPMLSSKYARVHGADGLTALAAPVTDIAVIALLLAAGVRVARGSRRPWGFLVGGFALLGTGDGVMAWLQLDGLLQTRAANNLCWTGGALLVFLAARSPIVNATPLAQDASPRRPFAVLLPYAPLLIGGAVTASQWVQGRLNSALVAIGATLIGLLFVRQLLAQFEAMRVSRELDDLLQNRTQQLQRQEQQLRSLVRHTSDVLTILDEDRFIRYQSAAAEAVLGCPPSQLIARPITEVVHPDDLAALRNAISDAPAPPAAPSRVDLRFMHADGGWVTTETTIADLRSDAGIDGFMLTIRDVSERKALEDQLRYDALHDPLTGLGNRGLFHDRVAHAAARAARNPQAIAVLMLDLDGFKDVNDTLGHAAGDRLLCEVADRLRNTLRPGDTIARMGGDEFAILLERAEPGVPETVAARILTGLRAPVEIDGRAIIPLGSMGVASAATNRSTAESLLRGADLALYQAKLRGKGGYAVFQTGMEEAALLRVELENDLRRAIRQDELVLYYQPIVEVPSGRISGVEALVRWNHPTKGFIPPGDFIPVAEDSDLVIELGRWVLWKAATQLRDWHERFPAPAPLTMSVNVAARQLLSPWLVQEVERILQETGITPSTLVLEITEGALLSDSGPIEQTLSELRALGVRLAIDDFGTGWSSLSRLRAFPVDKLKIDRSFVNEIASPNDDAPLIAAIVAMAHGLGLTLVAEGVETVEQLACLHSLGCEEVQGFLLGRPVAAEALESVITAPSGLLTDRGAATAAEPPSRSVDERELMALVASAAVGDDSARLLPAMLNALQRVSDLGAVYLTRVSVDEQRQDVAALAHDAALDLPVGTQIPWGSSPCARMLDVGQRTASMPNDFPDHPLTLAGAKTHLSVPVVDVDGVVWGTLCGASAAPVPVSASLVVLFELFASVIAQHLFGTPDATVESTVRELAGARRA